MTAFIEKKIFYSFNKKSFIKKIRFIPDQKGK